jgi:hypothetical protein
MPKRRAPIRSMASSSRWALPAHGLCTAAAYVEVRWSFYGAGGIAKEYDEVDESDGTDVFQYE